MLFESAVIAEYVNDVTGGSLLARDAVARARQRAWIEFASATIAAIGRFYSAETEQAFEQAGSDLRQKWSRLDANLGDGPWFADCDFSLVDAAFAPAFRYFEILEQPGVHDLFADLPKVNAWRSGLAERESVVRAVGEDYGVRLIEFLARKQSVVGRRADEFLSAASRTAAV